MNTFLCRMGIEDGQANQLVYITTVMHIVHEIQYIYWAYPLTWSVSSVIYFIYYHRSDWIHGFEAKEH